MLPRIAFLLSVLLFVPAFAQQPNSPSASLVFAGVDGPAFPITVNFQGTVVGMTLRGAPGQPYFVYGAGQNLTGNLAPGFVTFPGVGIVDIDITNGVTVVLDGFLGNTLFDRLSRIDPTGESNWTFPVAATGRLGAFQGGVLDPTVPSFLTLTAASEVSVTVGQNLILTGGDDVVGNIPLAFGAVNFYGTTYTNIFVSSNGNVTFGGGDADFLPTLAKMDAGFPRMAPLWVDLVPGLVLGGGQQLLGSFGEDATGWTMTWIGMNNYPAPNAAAPNPGANNTYSLTYAYSATNPRNPTATADAIIFDFTTAAAGIVSPVPPGVAANWGTIGITPGGTAPSSPANPAGSTPLDTAPVAFDPAVDPNSVGGGGLTPTNALSSYRADYQTPGTFPNALYNRTGNVIAFFPLGAGGTFYALF